MIVAAQEGHSMTSETNSAVSTRARWAGWILSALPALMLVASGAVMIAKLEEPLRGFVQLGYPESVAPGIGALAILCAVLYIIPRTSVLGAILLTGYLGGATATHVRVGEHFIAPVVFGVVVWLGLYLREPRIRALVPFRSDPSAEPVRMGLFKKLALGLVALVVVFALVVGLRPGEFRIARSATIAAPPAQVFAQVNDFHNWDAWSPWAKLDPNARTTFEGSAAGNGAVFTWSGNNEIGEGRMTITDSHPNDLVRIKLDFIRPFASTSTAEFTFQPKGDETLVTWSMYGENNYVAKAFCMFMDMDKMLGAEFEKGLAQMKAVAEAKK
jgi:hypothetical protein